MAHESAKVEKGASKTATRLGGDRPRGMRHGSDREGMAAVGWEQRVYPAAKIALIVDALAEEGVPKAEALRGTGVTQTDLRSPSTEISVDQVIATCQNAIRLSRAPHFAFNTGLRTHVSSYGMYGFAILSSMDFRETMRFAVKYHQLATPLVEFRFREDGARAEWEFEPVPHPDIDARVNRFIVEMQIGVYVSLHRDIMGSAFSPSALHVKFEAPEPDAQGHQPFGCPLTFGQSGNRFLYDAAWLNGSPRFGNEIIYGSVLALCDDLKDRLKNRVGVVGRARAFLLANLGRHASLEDVAAHLGAPARTVRRKLREEDTSFRELFDQLRAEVATKYLRDTEMTMDDIAEALGFSDAANFRHAFRRWNRTSPSEFKRTVQGDRVSA